MLECDLGVGGFAGAVRVSFDFLCGPEAFDPVNPPSVCNSGLRGTDGFQGEGRLRERERGRTSSQFFFGVVYWSKDRGQIPT